MSLRCLSKAHDVAHTASAHPIRPIRRDLLTFWFPRSARKISRVAYLGKVVYQRIHTAVLHYILIIDYPANLARIAVDRSFC